MDTFSAGCSLSAHECAQQVQHCRRPGGAQPGKRSVAAAAWLEDPASCALHRWQRAPRDGRRRALCMEGCRCARHAGSQGNGWWWPGATGRRRQRGALPSLTFTILPILMSNAVTAAGAGASAGAVAGASAASAAAAAGVARARRVSTVGGRGARARLRHSLRGPEALRRAALRATRPHAAPGGRMRHCLDACHCTTAAGAPSRRWATKRPELAERAILLLRVTPCLSKTARCKMPNTRNTIGALKGGQSDLKLRWRARCTSMDGFGVRGPWGGASQMQRCLEQLGLPRALRGAGGVRAVAEFDPH